MTDVSDDLKIMFLQTDFLDYMKEFLYRNCITYPPLDSEDSHKIFTSPMIESLIDLKDNPEEFIDRIYYSAWSCAFDDLYFSEFEDIMGFSLCLT